MDNDTFDVIVIGAGENGMVLGTLLGKAGLRVLICQRRLESGGGLSTEEFTLLGCWHNTGAYYHDNFGIEAACLRIGTVSRDDDPKANVRLKATWLSHRDAVHLIDRCLSVENLGYQIFYGVSNNTWRFWDIEHAKQFLGYDPQDNAQDHWPPA